MISLALLFIGFSVVSALLIAVTHFREANYSGERGARRLGIALVAALAGLQLAHWGWLYLDEPWVASAPYRVLLFVVAPVFWSFGRGLLRPDVAVGFRPAYALHGLPVIAAPWLAAESALPLAFMVGAGYLLALARDLFRLRGQREQFAKEILLLGTTFAIAVGVAVLGVLQYSLPDKMFFILYAVAIGLAFLFVQIALGLRPHLSAEVAETARAAYANSTLTHVDRAAVLGRLARLMGEEKVFEEANLGLAALADRLGLSSHQLSELMNVDLGKSFSRYLREQRVAAAKAMLSDDPSASVLSVGLSVGFGTQSNFYEAFREIEGMTPGQYRKLHSGPKRER